MTAAVPDEPEDLDDLDDPVVHLDDLAAPRCPPAAAELIDAAAPLGDAVALTVDAIASQAAAETGLADFGPDGWQDRLGLLVGCLSDEAPLSAMGRLLQHTLLVQLLRNRLLVTDLLRRHPEIHEIEIARPIIIAGLPRTGTTHLHNLLAADPALRSLPYWESLEPVLPPAEQAEVDAGAADPRLARTEVAVDFINTAMPHFRRMHEMTVDHVHEEIQLLAIDLCTMLFDTIAPMASWRAWYRDHDHTPHYEYLKTVLQVLTFLRGGDRWVLKSPQHLEQLTTLRRVFPDATVIVTHRDPVSVTASMATMVAYTARIALDPVDPHAIGHYWADLLAEMLSTCAETRDVWPDDQSVDVQFDAFMADDVGTLARIYDLAGQPLDDRARAAHRAYLDAHRRDRFGRVHYELADVGLDADDLERAFAGYVERFGVTRERSTPAPGGPR